MIHLEPIFHSPSAGASHSSEGAGLLSGLLLLVMAVLLIGSGIRRLNASLDDLWQSHERAMLARGLAPQRNAVWENNARSGAWASIVLGALLLLFSLWMLDATPEQPEKMSGTTINGRQLTQKEWEGGGEDIVRCTSYYAH